MDIFLNSDFLRSLSGLRYGFLGNSLSQWAFAFCLTVFVFAFMLGLKRLILDNLKKILQRKTSRLSGLFVNMLKAGGVWFILAISVYIGSKSINLNNYERYIINIIKIAIFIQVGVWLNILLSELLHRWKNKHNQGIVSIEAVVFDYFGRFLIWTLILLLTLDNLGVKVVSLMTGLGIGGIAVALAIQKILGDWFASISIMFDKPFEIGDMIVIGEFSGFIEKIGLKTTRMRSISGEQLIISNSDLLESRIRNYKRMSERRITLNFGVTHQTPREDLKAIPQILKEIVEKQQNTRFDRAHLQKIGDFSMIYECVYWSLSPDYKVFMDVQQSVNLSIIDAFAERNISFARPAQTLFVHDGRNSTCD